MGLESSKGRSKLKWWYKVNKLDNEVSEITIRHGVGSEALQRKPDLDKVIIVKKFLL